jgi:uncharacterized protein
MVAEAMWRYPGRFIGYAAINPNYPDSIVPELERCFDKLGMKGIKFHQELHGYRADGPSYHKALEFANERRAFVLGHNWGSPRKVEELASRYTDASFIVGHFPAYWHNDPVADEWVRVFRAMPNVYADTASSMTLVGGFDKLVRMVGASKILLGSDAPLTSMACQAGRVIFARISDEEKKDVLGRNAQRLLSAVREA